MLNAEDEVLIDTRISCTTEEAVIKLLGWMRGPVLKRVIKIAAEGEVADSELPHYGFVDDPIDDFLAARRERASVAFHNAVASRKYSFTELVAMEEKVDECTALIKKAIAYRRDIAEDLADAATGTLRVDPDETARQGTLHITLNSLDRWARAKYGIFIDEPDPANEPSPALKSKNAERLVAQRQEDQKVEPAANIGVGVSRGRAKNVLRTLAILISACGDNAPDHEKAPDLDPDEGLSRAKADQVFKTIDVLVNAFSSTAPKYRSGGGPNLSTIALHLADVAIGETGQSYEAIRKTLAEARKRSLRVS